ncbi:MAG: hypothetical protein J1D88_09960 [Treponema sp.]|nr:hypothetical protein [Treponema sp.]
MNVLDGKYTQAYTVQSHFIDGACRFTLLGMLAKSQDLVSFHFGENRLSIPHLNEHGRTWVVSKQHFEIDEYPLWRDELALQSWMEPVQGPFVTYNYAYSFVEPHGKKLTAEQCILNEPVTVQTQLLPFLKATSLWILLDVNTLRPVRPTEPEFARFITCTEKTVQTKFPKLELPEQWHVEQEFCPTRLDIDLNGHVNNLEYIKYIMSWLPDQVSHGKLVCTLDTNYLSSAHISDTLICRSAIQSESETQTVVVHSIVRGDNSEVFRARSVWQEEWTLSRRMDVMNAHQANTGVC